jgi:hypothetical protein
VHVNRAPRINPNNCVILRSLMSSLPSLTLVARMVFSVQAATGRGTHKPVQGILACRRTVRRRRPWAGIDIRSGRRRHRRSRGNRLRGRRNITPAKAENRPLLRPASPTTPSQLCAYQGRQKPGRNAGSAPAPQSQSAFTNPPSGSAVRLAHMGAEATKKVPARNSKRHEQCSSSPRRKCARLAWRCRLMARGEFSARS